MTTHAIIRQHIRQNSHLSHRVPRKLVGETVAIGLVFLLFIWMGVK